MTSGTLSSGSYSSNAVAPDIVAPDFSSIITSYMQNKTSKDNQDSANETSEHIASGNNETSVEVAKIQAEAQKEIAEENRKTQEYIASEQLKLDRLKAQDTSSRESALARSKLSSERYSRIKNIVSNESDIYDLYTKMKSRGYSSSGSSDLSLLLRELGNLSTNLGFGDINKMTYDEFRTVFDSWLSGSSDNFGFDNVKW